MADVPPLQKGDFAAFDRTLEQALIGWALKRPEAIPFMQPHVAAGDFADPLHQRIIERIFAKFEADRPVTPGTMVAAMKADASLAELPQGVGYFEFLAQNAPHVMSEDLARIVAEYARQVAQLRIRRQAEEAVIDSFEALRHGLDIDFALAPTIAIADLVNERMDAQAGSVTALDASSAALRELENRDPDARLPAAPTGLALLDRVIGGLTESNLVVVGGRPGMGKSIMGTTCAIAAANAGYDVDYFSLEMTARELTIRMLCDLAYDEAIANGWMPIHYSRALLRRLSASEIGRLAEARQRLPESIKIHDRDELTMSQIASIARAETAARPHRRRIIIIDHMHLIEPSDRYRGRKVDEISEVTKGAKRLAKRLGAGVVLLAQLNREVDRREDKMPTMADFRDAGSIEQDADVMLGLNRPHYWLQREKPSDKDTQEKISKRTVELTTKTNVLEIGVIKNRHGATDDLTLYCDVAASVMRDEAPPAQGTFHLTQGERFL